MTISHRHGQSTYHDRKRHHRNHRRSRESRNHAGSRGSGLDSRRNADHRHGSSDLLYFQAGQRGGRARSGQTLAPLAGLRRGSRGTGHLGTTCVAGHLSGAFCWLPRGRVALGLYFAGAGRNNCRFVWCGEPAAKTRLRCALGDNARRGATDRRRFPRACRCGRIMDSSLSGSRRDAAGLRLFLHRRGLLCRQHLGHSGRRPGHLVGGDRAVAPAGHRGAGLGTGGQPLRSRNPGLMGGILQSASGRAEPGCVGLPALSPLGVGGAILRTPGGGADQPCGHLGRGLGHGGRTRPLCARFELGQLRAD